MLLAGGACTSNQRVEGTAVPAGIRQYLVAHHPADVQVTDQAGSVAWLHGPRVEGDSLVGTLSRDEPRMRRAVALSSIRFLSVPHFSAARTLGLVGGVVGSAGLTLLILSAGNDPVY